MSCLTVSIDGSKSSSQVVSMPEYGSAAVDGAVVCWFNSGGGVTLDASGVRTDDRPIRTATHRAAISPPRISDRLSIDHPPSAIALPFHAITILITDRTTKLTIVF